MKPKKVLTVATVALSTVASAQRVVTVDFQGKTQPRSSMATFSVGSDRALIFLRKEHQRDLLALQCDIGFRYLRCHGLLNEEMKIVTRDAEGKLRYDWKNVDAFIDQLRAAKLKPFVELGFIPETMASGKQTIFWWRGNVTPPAKMEEWEQLVSEFAKHSIQRYGRKEVQSWYFEVWNEPNLDGFWTGGQAKYFELYAASARALKQVDPALRVGGPATAGFGWIQDFLKYCQANQVPYDFASTHGYAAMQGFLDEKGQGGGTVLDTSPDALTGGFKWLRGDIPNGVPLYITEWGPSYSPRDPIHDSYVCAPFILQKVREGEGLVDGMSYWTFSDQFEEPGPPNKPFHGGFGLMTVDGLRKPAYFAYELLAKLFPTEITTGQSSVIATKKGDQVRLVLWDYSPPKQDVPNDPFYHRDLLPKELGSTTVELRNLPNGRYRVRRFGIGYMRNDIYGQFLKETYLPADRAHFRPEALKKLQATYQPMETLRTVTVKDGTAKFRLRMRTNDVWYLQLERISPLP